RLLGVLARLGDHAVGVAARVGHELLGVGLGVAADAVGLLERVGDALFGLGGVGLGVGHEALGLLAGLLVALGVGALGRLAALRDLRLGVGQRAAGLLQHAVGLGLGLGRELVGPAPSLGEEPLDVEARLVAQLVRLALGRGPQLGRVALG